MRFYIAKDWFMKIEEDGKNTQDASYVSVSIVKEGERASGGWVLVGVAESN